MIECYINQRHLKLPIKAFRRVFVFISENQSWKRWFTKQNCILLNSFFLWRTVYWLKNYRQSFRVSIIKITIQVYPCRGTSDCTSCNEVWKFRNGMNQKILTQLVSDNARCSKLGRVSWTAVDQRNSLGESARKVGVAILLAYVLLWHFSMGLASKLVQPSNNKIYR